MNCSGGQLKTLFDERPGMRFTKEDPIPDLRREPVDDLDTVSLYASGSTQAIDEESSPVR